ncbi:MAG TPA: TonB-dependent receptor [Croceibacterium sp.]|nr:TonB-dependent receptor [Croceibacterium sp.]
MIRASFPASLRLSASFAVLAISAAIAAGPAAAQEADASERTDEIIVTAQFREQNVQDTPLAITAVTGDQLEARSQTRLSDITAQVPSLQLQPGVAGYGKSMSAFIRGLGQADISPSVEPGVGIYIDDVYFATVTASIFDLMDLDRIEILRGPQGTLAGMNSEGGALKLYSRKPDGEGGYVEATVGNMGRIDFKASADFTLVPDQLFARISGLYKQRDGHVTRLDYACTHPDDPYVVSGALTSMANGDDCKLGELGDTDVKALRGSLRWLAGAGVEINVVGDYTLDKAQTQATTLLQAGTNAWPLSYQGVPYDNRFVPYGANRGDTVFNDPFITYANFYDPGVTWSAAGPSGAPDQPNGPFQVDPQTRLESWGVAGTVDIDLGSNLALKSITGYRKYDSLAGDDNDGSPVVFIQEQQLMEHEQFSQELRLSGSLVDNTVHFTVGGIYFDQQTRYYNKNDTPFGGFGTPSQPTFAFINDDVVDLYQIAGFGNVSWELTDALTLEGGLRVTHEKKDYLFGRFAFDGSGDPFEPLSNPANPLNGRVGTFEGTIVDYRAAASYKITPDVMAYAQFATGFKGGGITPRPYFPEQVLGFGTENVRSYEVGLKTQLFDRRLRVNGDVYYMDFIGYQGTPQICVDENGDPLTGLPGTPGLCGQYINLGDAKLKGFELEVSARPIAGLSIDASASLNDFEFGTPYVTTNEIVPGASRPGIGRFKWAIGAQYEFPVGNAGTLTPRIDVNHTPGYCGNFACTDIAKVDAYDLVNARLTFRSAEDDWSVSLEATNLFDKFYYLNKIVTSYAAAQPGRPREYALTVRRNF